MQINPLRSLEEEFTVKSENRFKKRIFKYIFYNLDVALYLKELNLG